MFVIRRGLSEDITPVEAMSSSSGIPPINYMVVFRRSGIRVVGVRKFFVDLGNFYLYVVLIAS